MFRRGVVDGKQRLESAGWILVGVLVAIVCVAGGYEVLHGGRRLTIFQGNAQTSALAGDAARAKPSPAIPFGAKTRVAPSPVVAAIPPDSTGVPPTITEPAEAGEAAVVVKAKDTEGVYAAKHQKSFGRGCDGRLELSASGVDFTCATGSDAPLHFAVAEIKGANSNGIELKSGEKYHFDLQRGKAAEQELFRNWAFTHIPGAYAKASN